MIARGILPCATSVNRDWSEIINHKVVLARYDKERCRNGHAERVKGKPPRIYPKREKEGASKQSKHYDFRSTHLQKACTREKGSMLYLLQSKIREKLLGGYKARAKHERDMKSLKIHTCCWIMMSLMEKISFQLLVLNGEYS